MSAAVLREDQWNKILNFICNNHSVYVAGEAACRLFTEAVLRIARSGAQWRLLPEKYGKRNSVYKRSVRWSANRVWEDLHQFFIRDPDMESLMIDSTVIRAHPCAAGALKKHGGQKEQALGRSRGGFSTEIHVAADAPGNPLRFIPTPGQTHDVTQAENLTACYEPQSVIADKGYDSDQFGQSQEKRGIETVIPFRSGRKNPYEYDRDRYKERHLVECFINKIRHFRRIFSRFDKLAERYMSFLQFVGAIIWLR
ncbi:MAG: IS5 family transposase [Desulfobacteraceae bacterium]|nr:IS5 family transposase [Desulfobacteraceae bacterium]